MKSTVSPFFNHFKHKDMIVIGSQLNAASVGRIVFAAFRC